MSDIGRPWTVPTFTTNRSTGEVPSSTPAASPRLRRRLSAWPPHRCVESASESTTDECWWSCTASGSAPPGSSRCSNYGASGTDFSRAPSCLASRTRVVWQYQPVPALLGLPTARLDIPRVELPPDSTGLLRQPGGEGLSPHSIPWRLVAHQRGTTNAVRQTRLHLQRHPGHSSHRDLAPRPHQRAIRHCLGRVSEVDLIRCRAGVPAVPLEAGNRSAGTEGCCALTAIRSSPRGQRRVSAASALPGAPSRLLCSVVMARRRSS